MSVDVDIPALFLLDCGVPHFRLDDGDCPAPDERCILRAQIALEWVARAEPDNGSGVTFDYVVDCISMQISGEKDWKLLSGEAFRSALSFLQNAHQETLDAAAASAVISSVNSRRRA